MRLFYAAALFSFASALTCRVCDGYSSCDLGDETKYTKQCETGQVCFFKEELYIVAQNISIDYSKYYFGTPFLSVLSLLPPEQQKATILMANKQIVQVGHIETAGCVDKNSTLQDNKQQADCGVDLHAELYRIKSKTNLTHEYICELTCDTDNCNVSMDNIKAISLKNPSNCSIREPEKLPVSLSKLLSPDSALANTVGTLICLLLMF